MYTLQVQLRIERNAPKVPVSRTPNFEDWLAKNGLLSKSSLQSYNKVSKKVKKELIKYLLLLKSFKYFNFDFSRALTTILKNLEKTIRLFNVISIRKKPMDLYLNASFTIWILMVPWFMIKAP